MIVKDFKLLPPSECVLFPGGIEYQNAYNDFKSICNLNNHLNQHTTSKHNRGRAPTVTPQMPLLSISLCFYCYKCRYHPSSLPTGYRY